MEKLALFSPWPPQHSGIADYAFDLATGLAREGVSVHVFTDARRCEPTTKEVQILPTRSFPGPQCFDRVIYQVGNHANYHRSMIVPLGEHGGIVHLHDMVVHHLVHDLTCGFGDGYLYYRLLKHWYGPQTFEQVSAWNRTNDNYFTHSPHVTDVPLFEPILRYADACIVHSEFTRQRVLSKFPQLPCEVVPQAYRNSHVLDRARNEVLQIGTFGAVNPTKHLDQILWALGTVIAHQGRVHLHVVGNLDAGAEQLQGLVRELNLQPHVTFHGRVHEGDFHRLMQQVDLCVALRNPTMGETSGVVSRAIQMGIPTIVNDIGWYAELPPCVEKLPVDLRPLQQQLVQTLLRHALDHDHHARVRAAAARYAREVVNFQRVTARYRSIVNSFPATGSCRPDVAAA